MERSPSAREKDVESGGRIKPKKSGPDCFLTFCRVTNCVTGLSAVLCLVAHAMALAVGPPLTEKDTLKVQILRVYGVLLSAGLAVVETEWQTIMALMKLLESWIARGIIQAFLAVLTFEIATSSGDSDFDKSVRLYRTVAGTCMLSCAGFYMLGGVLCFGMLKQARYKRELLRAKMEQDLQALERQRAELEGLLSNYKE